MGPTPMIAALARPAPPVEEAWLEVVRAQVTHSLGELLELPDEVRLDTQWARALEQVRAYVARPAWHGRAALMLAGYCLARGSTTVPARLWRFAAGLELLHVARAIHDEVMGPPCLGALSPVLSPGSTGDHLAVVVGDHLFARALETMLGTSLPGATQAGQYCLRLARTSAVGDYRMRQGGALAGQGGVRQTLRLVQLRVVRDGLASALVCGALLAGADEPLRLRLARVGCNAGLARELNEELSRLLGPSGDFVQGHCTFPLVAAWSRARPEAREELEALWRLPPEHKDAGVLARVRDVVEEAGGRLATERLMARATHGANRALGTLPHAQGLRELLRALIGQLTPRPSTPRMVSRGEAP